MQITLESLGNLEYRGVNDRNQEILLSGSKQHVSPMESVLMAIASCSSIDIEIILSKMRQKLDKLKVNIDATRATDSEPAVFTNINVHYTLFGEVKPEKAAKAIELGLKKYCSVATMIEKTAKIEFDFTIIKKESI